MRKFILSSLIIIHCSCLLAQNPIPGQYVVIMKESVAIPAIKSGLSTMRSANNPNTNSRSRNQEKISSLRSDLRISPTAVLFDYADAVVGFSAKLTDGEVSSLRSDARVEGVYQDYHLKLEQTFHMAASASLPSQIEDCSVVSAGGHGDGSTKFTWIWIVDTGIDTDHPDLSVQVKVPYATTFIGNSFEDLNGHGTHVAGIAGAKNNGFGVVGISAGAKLVPVKAIDDLGNTSFSLVLAAINHVAQYAIPGDAVNLSLGGFMPDCGVISYPALPAAITNLASAGVWISMAAGNDNNNATMYLPGCIDNRRIFTVAAIDCNSSCTAYSNLGSNVDWYAVGTNVYSTYKDGGYATLTGTSMAAPVVTGIVHLRGQAPVKGSSITCSNVGGNIIRPLALRQ